jgi:pimeloyl-ACP methyl ester carboxylesterase
MPWVERDVSLYYVDEGSVDEGSVAEQSGGQESLFFCHGAGGNSTSWWHQIGNFATRYRCLAHDHRGFGRSACPPDAFSIAAFADDALAVMDAAGVGRAHFVCQSMGGWTGVRMALEHPERVASLVLSDTIGGLALPSGLESIRTMGPRAEAAGAISPALAADYPLKNPAGAFLYLQLAAFNSGFEALDLFRRLFAQEALISLDRASELRLPILIVAGHDDLIWPPSVLRELAQTLPDARFVEVDAGHSPYFENPEAFNRVLDGFLET